MELTGTLHVIKDDLAQDWVGELTDSGVEAIEDYLAKYLAFLTYLDDAASPNPR